MKEITLFGHQGDLNFRKVDSIPDGFTKVEKKEYDAKRGGYTLALGEHSGHAHTLIEHTDGAFEVYKDSQGRHVLNIKGAVSLMHGTFIAPAKIKEEEVDKHATITFQPGIYVQDYEEAYDPFLKKLQRVVD